MKKILIGLFAGLMAVAVQAQEVTVSWVSNGVIEVSGMQPQDHCALEWTSDLQQGFAGVSPNFEHLLADSNGTVQVAVPMFFRARVDSTPPVGMVLIPAGTNSGTNPLGDGESYDSSYPENYSLTMTDAFYMDQTEVMKAQWDAVYNWATNNSYSFDYVGLGKALGHPVHTVSWYDCVKWCNARSEMDGRVPCYTVSGTIYKTGQSSPDCNFDANGYRLPTSDEWEYAVRGGLSGKRFPWGDTINHDHANYWANGSAYSYDTSPYTGDTFHPDYDFGDMPYTSSEGSFPANGYGLYDMAGNLWEWCWDASGSGWLIRGGSWGNPADHARCGNGYASSLDHASHGLGFRSVSR